MVTCPSLMVLTRSELLTRMLAAPMDRGVAFSTGCLGRSRMPHRFMDLLVDPEGIRRCCLVVLQSWRGDHRVREVLYLDRPVPGAVYAALEAAHPGRMVDATEVVRALRAIKPRTTHRTAWEERDLLLSSPGWGPRESRFLEMARSRRYAERGEEAVARELGLSARQLERLSYRWLGFPPKINLDLCRVDAAARELAAGDGTLQSIADRSGYTSARTLHRHFIAYTGVTPSAWRRREERRQTSGEATAPIAARPRASADAPSAAGSATARA